MSTSAASGRETGEKMSAGPRWLLLSVSCLLVALATGCQQKMAQMPFYKPYEPTDSFPDGRSNRPLEPGVIHRAQPLEESPLVSGLTAEEWTRARRTGVAPKADGAAPPPGAPGPEREMAIGAPRYDPRQAGEPKVYNAEFPFEITSADLLRGQERFTIYCAVCHGPLGNGKGKIWERGYLKPTSYHTEKVSEYEPDETGPDVPLGFSRGYARWGIRIPVREVPVGYIFEVITRGFGAMPDHAAQIPPADRWRIIAYVRTLQYAQKPEMGGKK
jgi:mono/diheme cytochrome c family protein